MKLYHGTSREAFESILSDGFLKTKFGEICLTEEPKVAAFYGNTQGLCTNSEEFYVLEIDSKDLDNAKLESFSEPICKLFRIKDFYSYTEDIPVDKIKFFKHETIKDIDNPAQI